MLKEKREPQAYTISDICNLLNVSRQTAIRLFEDEPGVIDVGSGSKETMHKRGYRVLRVPHSVYDRVIRRLSK